MKNIVVLGAGSGLGLELVRHYISDSDANIIATLHAADDGLSELACDRLAIERLDVTSKSSRESFVDSVARRKAKVDILVSCVGIGRVLDPSGVNRTGTYHRLGFDQMTTVFQVNVIGPAVSISALEPHIADGGVIAAVSTELSSLQLCDDQRNISYSASKAALNMFVKKLSYACSSRGVVVVGIHPGWMRTKIGGPQADLSAADQSVHVARVLASTSLEKSGKLIDWQGNEMPW